MTYRELTYIIRGCVYEVYKQLGPGLLESVYERALIYELQSRGLHVQSQASVPILYKGQNLGTDLRIDILVNNAVVIELKSVETVLQVHKKQLLSYLRLADKRVGYLVNFNEHDIDLGITRIVNNLDENADI